ncbi:MAG: UDP-N-acetylmuramoyl-L-alanine--D-glutamate ligase [Patescibacteria group bacterium]|jgi:UDP-N-acetylmuramoylalanine--D-glutamate ligase
MDLSSIHNFQDAVVTVMGLGRYKQGSGMGAAKWLVRHGAQTVITDLKSAPELHESVTLLMDWYHRYRDLYPDRTLYQPVFVLGEHRKDDFVGVDCVVQNPGVPSESEFLAAAKEQGVPIESDVSLFFRFYQHPITAVTGTKGKTTTTLLLGEMMKRKDAKAVTAGNIKVSPLEHLDALLEEPSPVPVVLELSSWMLESLPQAFIDVKRGPDIAILTNVYPDHLDRYASFDAYVASKRIIFEHQTEAQFTLLNWDHELVRGMEPQVKGKLFWFSKEYQDHDGCYIKDGNIIFRRNGMNMTIAPVAEVALKGEHNIENILSASCAAMLSDISLVDIAGVLKSFEGVTDRQEIVREVDEITYVNDTAATGPDAVVAALRRFHGEKPQDIVLIAGGVNKNLVFQDLAEEVVKTCKSVFLLPGDASDLLATAIRTRIPVTKVTSMKDAVQKARAAAVRGDTVLLSPGATSFNLFRNEFERGEQFREEVRNL